MGLTATALSNDLDRALEDWDRDNLEIQPRGSTEWKRIKGFLSTETVEGYEVEDGAIAPYTRRVVRSPENYLALGGKIRVDGTTVYEITAITSNEGLFEYALRS